MMTPDAMRLARLAHGLTQADLAARIGVLRPDVIAYERRGCGFPASAMRRAEEILGSGRVRFVPGGLHIEIEAAAA